MSETWEQTKARLRKQGVLKPVEVVIEVPKTRFEEPEPVKIVPRYEIRKITLPIDPEFPQGKIVVVAVTKEEAEWWLEYRLKTKTYQDDSTDSKTMVFYEKFLIGGTPRERNIYSNPERFCTEEFPHFNNPKRIN